MADVVYANYWRRKQLLASSLPAFPVVAWWPDAGLSAIESVYFEAVRGAARLLDVGAGDLRVMRKFRAAGFAGDYHTQDVGGEFAHTFADLDEIPGSYDAVVCLDVLEHLPLERGLAMLLRLYDLTAPGGVLVLQTPNARCVRHPLSWDMTHLHIYNLPDLWAYLAALGAVARGYRVPFAAGPRTPALPRLIGAGKQYLITRVLGADYADNIALVAHKPAH